MIAVRAGAVMLTEAVAAARAARAASLLLVVIAGGVCAAIVATTGQTAATEQQVIDRFDDAASRALTIRTSDPSLIDAEVVAAVSRLSTVEAAVGLSPLGDVRNPAFGPGGAPVALWRLTGSAEGLLPGSDQLRPDQALATPEAAQRLGLVDLVGAVEFADGPTFAVVDESRPAAPLSLVDPGVVVRDDEPAGIQQLIVVSEDAGTAAALAVPVVAQIDPPDPDVLTVDSPAAFAELEAVVTADLAASGRLQLIGTLAAGALLMGGAVLGQVALRRRDLGRRRALGATRGLLVGLVVAQTAACAATGAALGGVVGSVVVWVSLGVAPPLGFVVGTAVLTVLAAATASVLPGVVAATRDPVTVLRTP